MNSIFKILFQSFVQPFYKENAGLFVFVFTMFFFIVGMVDGAGLYHYHYSLVKAMLTSTIFLIIVFFTWFLYVRKFAGFVSAIIANPAFQFLKIYNLANSRRRFSLFLLAEFLLLLPVLLYLLFISFVAVQEKTFLQLSIIYGYILLLAVVPAALHVKLLNSGSGKKGWSLKGLSKFSKVPAGYSSILLRFIFRSQPATWIGIKLYTCGILYLITSNNAGADYAIDEVFFFFNFGILANAILIYRLSEFEATYLSAFRCLPMSLLRRYFGYAFVYLLLFIPEIITAILLMPVHLHAGDAANFLLCGYSIVLLMHNILLLQNSTMRAFLKVLLVVLFIQYLAIITGGIIFLYLLSFALSALLFLTAYYRFEKKPVNGISV